MPNVTLYVHIRGCGCEATHGALVATKAEDLIPHDERFRRAQMPSGQDEYLYLTDEQLLRFLWTGGRIEIHRPPNLLASLEATYGPLPVGLSQEIAWRWLAPPHPQGIPLLQLLLARVLEM